MARPSSCRTTSPLKRLADLQGQKDRGRQRLERARPAGRRRSKARKSRGATSRRCILRPPTPLRRSARGAVDAWSIWDPFYAIAELRQKARPLPIDPQGRAAKQLFPRQQQLYRRARRRRRGDQHRTIATATTWAGEHRDETAALFAEASGVELDAQKRAVASAEFTFGPLDDKIIAEQQAVADRFSAPRTDPGAVTCATSSGTESRTS